MKKILTVVLGACLLTLLALPASASPKPVIYHVYADPYTLEASAGWTTVIDRVKNVTTCSFKVIGGTEAMVSRLPKTKPPVGKTLCSGQIDVSANPTHHERIVEVQLDASGARGPFWITQKAGKGVKPPFPTTTTTAPVVPTTAGPTTTVPLPVVCTVGCPTPTTSAPDPTTVPVTAPLSVPTTLPPSTTTSVGPCAVCTTTTAPTTTTVAPTTTTVAPTTTTVPVTTTTHPTTTTTVPRTTTTTCKHDRR